MKLPTIIDSGEALKDLVTRVRSCDRVALDTEFVWERTYYPRLGLIQVGLSMEECYLVDVPAIGDLNALGDLLETPTVQLVLHDAPQDLSILRRVTGAYPRTVFDTRCAAGFAGLSSTMSLSDLLEELVDVSLSKAASRTNWLQRPLTAAQLDYAAADVRYLIAASERLVQRASERSSEGWLAEEMRAYDQPSLYEERDEREQYTRLKGIHRCQPQELAVLRELAAWREREARRLDRPRSHIVGDRTLVHLARCKPTTLEDLKGFDGLSERKIRKCGTELVAAAVAGLRAKNCPTLPPRPPDPRARKRHIDALLDYVRRRGADVGIDPQLVTSRAELKDLFSGGGEQAVTRRIMGGWRKEFMGDLSAVGGGAALGLGAV